MFIVYPEAIAMMTGSVMWAIIFFLLLITLGDFILTITRVYRKQFLYLKYNADYGTFFGMPMLNTVCAISLYGKMYSNY